MTELIRSWVFGLTGVAFINAIAMTLAPKGKSRAIVGLTCGLVTVVALIAPILDFDYEVYALHVTRLDTTLEERVEEILIGQERLADKIIRERSQAYILDKANSLDIVYLTIEVETAQSSYGVIYPQEIWLSGRYTEEQRQKLGDFLSGTFGIPAERQHWSVANE